MLCIQGNISRNPLHFILEYMQARHFAINSYDTGLNWIKYEYFRTGRFQPPEKSKYLHPDTAVSIHIDKTEGNSCQVCLIK